jgi:hypothetical protein
MSLTLLSVGSSFGLGVDAANDHILINSSGTNQLILLKMNLKVVLIV